MNIIIDKEMVSANSNQNTTRALMISLAAEMSIPAERIEVVIEKLENSLYYTEETLNQALDQDLLDAGLPISLLRIVRSSAKS